MEKLVFRLNNRLFLRDPQTSELGQNIIKHGVLLIDKLGFEQFTFKKLAEEINSTEASIYRYFENKHRLLVYLIDWYWNWLEYRIELYTTNIQSPEERLRTCLRILSEEKEIDPHFETIDEQALHRIVLAEMDKTYLTKQVDIDNKDGLFLQFKSLCKKIAGFVLEVNPQFKHAHSLISTIMLTVNQQLFFAQHLPSLTNLGKDARKHHTELYEFIETLVFKTISRS